MSQVFENWSQNGSVKILDFSLSSFRFICFGSLKLHGALLLRLVLQRSSNVSNWRLILLILK